MNWEAIGSIGEIVGAIAVVATLIYLSRQIGMARKESKVQGTYASLEYYANWRSHLIDNPDLAEAVAQANRAETLSEEQTLRLTAFMDDLIITSYVSHLASFEGNPLYHKSSEVDYLIAFLQENPGMVSHWDRCRKFAEKSSPAFLKEMDTREDEYRTRS